MKRRFAAVDCSISSIDESTALTSESSQISAASNLSDHHLRAAAGWREGKGSLGRMWVGANKDLTNVRCWCWHP